MSEILIKWHFAERTWYTDEEAERLIEGIQASCQIPEHRKQAMETFCYILSATERVEFDERRVHSRSLQALPEFLKQWRSMSPSEVWDYRTKQIANQVWVSWANSFSSEPGLFEADDAAKPTSALSPEQQKEAANPNSPLASSGGNLPGS